MTPDTTIYLADISARLEAIERRLDTLTAPANADDLLTVQQVADMLGVTRGAIYHLDLPRYKRGEGSSSRSYYRRGDVIDFMTRRRQPSRREISETY